MTAFKAYEKWDTLTAAEQETRLANHEEEFKAIAGDKEFWFWIQTNTYSDVMKVMKSDTHS